MKRKLGKIVMALTVLSLIMCSTAFATNVRITGDCNVRTGPGLNYDKIAVAYGGETLEYWDETVTDNRGVDWYNVIYGNLSGWVSSKYAVLEEEAVPQHNDPGIKKGDAFELSVYYDQEIKAAADEFGCRYSDNWEGEDAVGDIYIGNGLTLVECYGTGRIMEIAIESRTDYSLLGLTCGMSRSEVDRIMQGARTEISESFLVLYKVKEPAGNDLINLAVEFDDYGYVSKLDYGVYS